MYPNLLSKPLQPTKQNNENVWYMQSQRAWYDFKIRDIVSLVKQ